uniref:protein FAM161A isoform X1 n=1 Tax=Jaculus jaculus TaxID=51337 RepID=UPI001E1AFD0F|nr:protein FAM161A isoform X1 [Jaculus jaculus]
MQELHPAAKMQADYNTISEVDEHVTYEDIANFSDIYHSNEEYFRKLEKLKAAHVETMAKLEKMYQDKLNLREVQPMIIREDSLSSSSVSEKNSCHPMLLVKSPSESELGRSSSLYTSLSEEELPMLERECLRKNRMMTYAKELINNMWTNFSVKDYIQCEDDDFQALEKPKKKPKAWAPTITVPVPFQMTIREQKKREEAMKARSDSDTAQKLLREQEEDLECKKKFRANPVPACVLVPLYQDIIRQNEERRRMIKEKSKQALLAAQKPFRFIAREEQKQAVREKQLRDFVKSKKAKRFKARPLPQSIYGSPTSDRLKEEELLKKIRMQRGAQELSENSFRFPCRPACRHFRNPKPKDLEQTGKLRCKKKGWCRKPDDEESPEIYKRHFSELNCPTRSTICKQFGLHETSSESGKRQKILADIRADEENLRETRWPFLSPRRKLAVRSASCKPRPCRGTPPRPTVSSRGREQAVRRSLEEKKMLEEERNRILTKQKQRMNELQKLLTTRVKAYDSHQSLAQVSKARVKYLRKNEKAWMKEYQQQLEEKEEKLKKRPFLFERVAQKNARMSAEKHYSNTLKALGISDEFVSKKGQSGKIFEYFIKQEMNSFTANKESFNEEEKTEERECEEENYIIDYSSQDSFKEKDEEVEESEVC